MNEDAQRGSLLSATPVGSRNYRLFALGLLVLALGYVALAHGPYDSRLSLDVAPLLLALGYCVLIPAAIMARRGRRAPGGGGGSVRGDARAGGGGGDGAGAGAPVDRGGLRDPTSLLAALVGLVAFLVYRRTLAPSVTLWDSGELVTAAYVLGITHPPGAPLYVLLGRLASMIPWTADVAARVNLMSALFAAATSAVVFLLIVRLARYWRAGSDETVGRRVAWAGGLVGALAFTFSDAQWSNALEAELYAPYLCLTALVLWLALRWAQERGDARLDRLLLLAFYLSGLALGVHVLHALALPAAFLLVIFRRRGLSAGRVALLFAAAALGTGLIYPGIERWVPLLLSRLGPAGLALLLIVPPLLVWGALRSRDRARVILALGLALVLLGFSTYAICYVRSTLDPPVDQNDPQTAVQLERYLGREQYGHWTILPRRAPLWDYQIEKMYVRYFGWQFVGKDNARGRDGRLSTTLSLQGLWGLPFLLGVLGLAVHFRRDWRRASTVLLLLLMLSLAVIVYINQEDPQLRERDYSYTGSFLAFALWIGLGAAWLLERAAYLTRQSPRALRLAAVGGAFLGLLLVPARMLAVNLPAHDRSKDVFAYDFAYDLLHTCAKDAILLSRGDNDTYPLWCLQEVYGVRPDVQVVNLQLLNAPWYVKQLKHGQPGCPVRWSDAQIDALQPLDWPQARSVSVPVTPQARSAWTAGLALPDSLAALAAAPAASFSIGPSLSNDRLLVRDEALLHILIENAFLRPVYLAPATAQELRNMRLDGYLRVEGYASRLLPVRGGWRLLDRSVLRENLLHRYRYTGLTDPSIPFDHETAGLVEDLRAAFLTLAECDLLAGAKADAVATLEHMGRCVSESVFPFRFAADELRVGRIGHLAGDDTVLQGRVRGVLLRYALSPQEKMTLAAMLLHPLGQRAVADSLVASVLGGRLDAPLDGAALLANYQRLLGDAAGVDTVSAWLRDWAKGSR